MNRQLLNQIIDKSVNMIFYLFMLGMVWIGLQIFFISSFKIPSDSMSPCLYEGDYVLVWKPVLGARLFNVFSSIEGKQVKIHRLPGWSAVKRNDVIVFNYPYPCSRDTLQMSIQSYFIKRCIGLPGDTLQIIKGIYKVRGVDEPLGNLESQRHISVRVKNSFEDGVYDCYPFDGDFRWNIHDFGPLYVPRKGDRISLDKRSFDLYRRLIAWEQQLPVTCRDSLVYIGGDARRSYSFRENYYFMAGDNGLNSKDSRYWGLLPEEFMVGKACLIWKSVYPATGRMNWQRTFKIIRE